MTNEMRERRKKKKQYMKSPKMQINFILQITFSQKSYKASDVGKHFAINFSEKYI